MRLTIKVKPNAKTASVTPASNDAPYKYLVAVKVKPVDGKATAAALKLLARHLRLAPSRLTIVSGLRSPIKIINIE